MIGDGFGACARIGILPVVMALVPMILLISPVQAGPNCYCRTSNSELIEVGDYTCIKTNEGLREARCEFVLNNTAWKLTGKLCPIGFNQVTPKEQRINIARIDFKNPY